MNPLLDEHRTRRLDTSEQDGKLSSQAEGLTIRGWMIGLFVCALLAAVVPYVDHILDHILTSVNLLAPQAIFFLAFFIVVFNMIKAGNKSWFRLTRQDLSMIFCMIVLINPLPAVGFMSYLMAAQMGPQYFARPENNWKEDLVPLIPRELTPHDPVDALSADPRPVEWFYHGLPNVSESMTENFQAIPWGHLAGPYAWWCLALLFMLGLFFALSGLLHPVWSERERLPFPVIQVPEQMMDGFFPQARSEGMEKPFFLDRMALWGIGLTFALHGWNYYANYAANWPSVPMQITHIDWTYLTETPWRYIQPLPFKIFPSVIGFMYLVSLEVSFSMWFFFAVVLKICSMIACGTFGLADNGWAFMWAREGAHGMFFNQGVGALFAIVLAGLFMARQHLWKTLRQALGLIPEERSPFRLSSRTLWGMLFICFMGAVTWLCYFHVSFYWAVLAVLILTLISIGAARLVAEGGVMYIKCFATPQELMQVVFTPAAIGSQNLVMTGVWGKVFEFDFYRMAPMINIIGALHAGTQSRTKPRWLLAGLGSALLLTFVVGFFSANYMVYTTPGGARSLGWVFNYWPNSFYGEQTGNIRQIKHWENLQKQSTETGAPIPRSEVPSVARTNWTRIGWMGVGVTVMFFFLFMRTRVFWWPHPIGYVLWMGFQGIYAMWFSYFLGWLAKFLLVRFGGQKQFLRWRRFFVGLIVGEALAIVFWIIIAWYMGHHGSVYRLDYN